MPKILERNGFRVIVLLPPREHGPAHVHVEKAGTRVVINLPDGKQGLSVRKVYKMRDADVVAAFSACGREH